MKHIGLFEGFGGFSLAAHWAGWQTIAWCEISPFCQKLLSFYFPKAQPYADIRNTDFSVYRGQCDILTGGFPCQPYSVAGKRKGKTDERHLWPEMLRAVRQIQPRWIVGENVHGIISWDNGVVFEEVHSDLEAEGYEVQSFIIPACATGAPHQRDRVWIVAHSKGIGTRRLSHASEATRAQEGNIALGGIRGVCDAANPDCAGCKKCDASNQSEGARLAGWSMPSDWENWPTQSPVCSRDDGLPTGMDGVAFSRWRNESLRGYGNAIVPQVALKIFEAVKDYERSI